MAAILKDFRSEIIKCSKYQLIFVTAEEVLSMSFLFWPNKKLPYRFILQLLVCLFLSEDSASEDSVFHLTHFYWLPAYFRKCSEVQLIRGCMAF